MQNKIITNKISYLEYYGMFVSGGHAELNNIHRKT